MANGTLKGNTALLLHELLSAPLVAMIQADALAARATVEFIEDVGFNAEKEGQPPNLRMAQFRFRKADENDQVQEFEAAVPLLSLMPIPSLQIKEGRVKLAAKIVDVTVQSSPPAAAERDAASRLPASRLLAARKVNLVARPVATSPAQNQERRGTFDLDIEITMTQADVPLGVEKLFQIMDAAINEKKS